MQTVTFNHPFRESVGVIDSSVATNLYEVVLAGHGYSLDLESNEFIWESLDAMRPQQDTSAQAGGEGSLSTVDLWRRSYRSWHEGAGQIRGEGEDASPYRYFSSKGLNPWEKWEISMLSGTSLVAASAAGVAGLIPLSTGVVFVDGDTLTITTDGATWSPYSVLPSTTTTMPTHDGVNLFAACADGQIRTINSAGAYTSSWAVSNVDVLGLSKGRLWAGSGNILKYMTPASGTVTDQVTVPFTDWRWTAICDGSRATYAAGTVGDRSEIYRIPLKADGTGLDGAVVAASLPDGETVHSLASYLGYILIGTSKGVRFAVADGNGDLNYGSYLPTSGPVECFEPQDRFVWFGWSNYDSESTGLGRVDLSTFTSDLTPAYASDLMYQGSGEVTTVVTWNDKRLFTVAGVGVLSETGEAVSTGSLVTSDVTFDLDNDKVATLLEVSHKPLDGALVMLLSTDGSDPGVVGESSAQGSTSPVSTISVPPVQGHRFALTFNFTPGVLLQGPVLVGAVFSAHPLPPRGNRFVLPLMLSEQNEIDSVYVPYNPVEEVRFLRTITRDGVPVLLQIGAETFTVFPANYRWIPYRQMQDKSGWTGVCIMELREVTQ